ncbi:MAG: hypothetical protein M1813_006622 [Trichoglossum hirsutum]|nr:MAG: hypothetical protein M1813_006622 [Trichoglossum hirsutum]
MAELIKKLSRIDYTVGWICALSIELAASSEMLDEVHQDLDLVQGDTNMYTLGEIGGHNIVIACLPAGNTGITPAANVATNMLRSFPKIRFGLMVGVGGGAPARRSRPNEDIRLGDVVVSIPQGELGGVVKYDRGKVVAGGEFQHTGLLNMPPTPLTNAVAKLRGIHESKRNAITRNVTAMINRVLESEDANPDFKEQYKCPDLKYDRLFKADYEHNESQREGEESGDSDDFDEIPLPCRGCDSTRLLPRKPRNSPGPVIHYGTIASADEVMRHGVTREEIRKKYGVLCFEMEAAGLMNDFPCLVVRGICDYSDTHKNKIWQRYAAATAAAYTKELLEVVLKEDIERTEDAVKVLERDKQRQDREKILNWLDSDTHTKRFIDSHEKWQPHTAQKLLHSEQYLNWTSNNTQTLWCHGIAGGGKTVFASVIVDNLKVAQKDKTPETKAGIACLFCEYERRKDQTVRSLTSAILRQLAHQCDVLPVSVTDLYDLHQTNDVPPRFEEISSALTDVLGNFPRVFLIVDALDECFENTRRELLSHLLEQQRKSGIKLLATSRPTIDFRKEFGACEELEIKADPQDVKNVLDILIEKSDTLIKTDVELRNRVTDKIAMAVNGMFLLVQPFLDSIMGERSRGCVEDALRALVESPDKISTVYEVALNRIGSQKPGDRKLAHRILSWIFESRRPLTRQEFLHALAVKKGILTFRKEYIINDLDAAVALCAGLVVINQKSNTVQLMHHTTRKYFEDHKHRPDWMSAANEMIASSCITYVSYSVFGKGTCSDDEELETRLSEYPFLGYAAQHWGNHARDDQERIEDLALEFLQDDAKVASSNQVIHLADHRYPGYSQDFIRDVNGLQAAASFGLANIVLRLISHGADTKAKDEDGRTALHRAAENGHDEVVRKLVEHGAEVNTKEAKYDQTPLHLAALNGHKAVAQVLLENGAKANLEDSYGLMAIHVAAWTGNEEVVRVLLGKIDVNETSYNKLTALHCAAAQGYQTVAQLLIREGADVDAEDMDGWTPLHWASKKRHDIMKPRMLTVKDESSTLLRQFLAKQEEVKEVLQQRILAIQDRLAVIGKPLVFWQDELAWLPSGVELDVNGGYGDILTKLHIASSMQAVVLPWAPSPEKEEELPAPVLFVLAIQDELTALHCAVECGHKLVARLLLKNGADIHKKCKAKVETKLSAKMRAGPTALHLAAFSGHEAMVRLLLEQGADVHTRSDTKARGGLIRWPRAEWTALHWAIVSGDEEVVQLLLDKGADIHDTCLVNLETMHCELTPLHLAVILGHQKVIRLLISNGVDVNARGKTNLDIKINFKTDEGTDKDADKDITFKTRMDLAALHLAALSGRHNVIQILLEKNADIETKFYVRRGSIKLQLTALHTAAICGHKEAAQLLLKKGADAQTKLRASKDSNMRAEIMLLHLVAFVDDKGLPELLIESGANVNAKCQIDVDAWEPSKQRTERETTRKPEGTKEEDHKAPLQRTAKLFAAFLGEEIADVPLLGKAAKAYGKHQKAVYTVHAELTPLHIAAMCANEGVVQVLLEKEADANAKFLVNINNTSVELTALHLATIRGHERIALLLLDVGADIHAKLQINVGSWLHIEATVLQLAAISGNDRVVQLLLDRGSDAGEVCLINNSADNTLNALHLGAIWGRERVVRLLIKNRLDISKNCWIKFDPWLDIELTVLHLAAMSGNMNIVQLLLKTGSNAHTRGKLHCYEVHAELTLQHLAAMRGHGGVVELLLKENYDIHAKCQVDVEPSLHAELTLLHVAALSGNEKILRMLLETGADTQQRALIYGGSVRTELTVLHLAAIARHDDIVKLLLGTEVDIQEHFQVNVEDMRAEFTLLHLAVLWRKHSTVQLLLEKGFDVHSKLQIEGQDTYIELTALHLAAAFAHKGIVQALLDHGADAGARCQVMTEEMNIDLSALHLATAWRNEDMMHLLLSTEPLEEREMPRPRSDSDSYSGSHLGAYFTSSCSDLRSRSNSRSPMERPVKRSRERSNGSYREKEHSREDFGERSKEHLEEGSIERSMENPVGSSQEPSRKISQSSSEVQSIEHPNERTSKADVNATFLLNIGNMRIELTAVHMAALMGSPQIIHLLLKDDADVNVSFKINSEDGHVELTALHLAVLWGSQAMVRSLLGSEADIQARLQVSISGVYAELSALHLATILWSTGVAKLLLDNHVDAQTKCPVGVRRRVQAELTILHLVALSKHNDIVELLNKGVDVHAKCLANIEFWLHSELAVTDITRVFKNATIVNLLANNGPKVGPEGQTNGPNGVRVDLMALLFATALGREEVELVLSSIDDIDGECSIKMQAKVETAFKIPMQADVDAIFEINMEAKLSALHMAAALGDVEVVRLLLDKGASLEGKCQINVGDIMHAKLPALHLAAMWKHDEVAQLLLKKGADAHATGQVNINRTVQADLIAPHLATMFGHEGVLRLFKGSVDIDVIIQAHPTALHFAALMDNDVMARSLLERGTGVDANCLVHVEAKTKANIEANIQVRLAALHVAAWAGHERVARLLLKMGADVNSTVQVGGKAVLGRGAHISRKIQAGGTALHLAAGLGHEEVLRILIGSGANINAKSQDGRTPIQWAKDHGHDEAVQLILESQLRNNGTPGSSERGRLRQKWHDVFSKSGSSASLGKEEENSLTLRDESPRPEESKYHKEGVGNFLARMALQKSGSKLRRFQHGP